jgi:hypothetical protein
LHQEIDFPSEIFRRLAIFTPPTRPAARPRPTPCTPHTRRG